MLKCLFCHKMRFIVLICLLHLLVFAACYNAVPRHRSKREAAGALHIVTNHAQPIHEDVKPEAEDPLKVVPPKDVWFEGKSLRKSLPLTSKLDLIRSTSRIITLFVLIISGVVEFYPLFQNLCNTIYSFMYA